MDQGTNVSFGDMEPRLKEAYAEHLHSGLGDFTAALRIWSEDPQLAYWVSLNWPQDPFVKDCLARLKKDKKSEYEPPSKIDLAYEIYSAARAWTKSPDNQIKAYRLVADMLGYIEKAAPNTAVTVQNVQSNKVMVVRDFGNDDQWEATAVEQQTRLRMAV